MIDGDSEALFSINAPTLTQVGTNSYQLPDDFYRLVSIDLKVSGRYHPGQPGEVRELAYMADDPPEARNFRYFIRFNMASGLRSLFIYPEIDESQLAIVYVPEAPLLVADTDTFNAPNQWHEYVIVSAAIKMNSKKEKDTTALEFQRRNLEKRIMEHIRDIDTAMPRQIREVAHIVENQHIFRDNHPRP